MDTIYKRLKIPQWKNNKIEDGSTRKKNFTHWRIRSLWRQADYRKNKFYRMLQQENRKIKNHQQLIIAEGLNRRISRRHKDNTIGCFGQEVLNDNWERIVETCKRNKLTIAIGFFIITKICTCIPGYHKQDKLKFIVKYFIVKKETTLEIKDVRETKYC